MAHVHELDGIIALRALQRLVQLRLDQIPDTLIFVLALAERVAALLRVVDTNVLDLARRPLRLGREDKHVKTKDKVFENISSRLTVEKSCRRPSAWHSFEAERLHPC